MPVEVRIVAATNADLESRVREHRGEDGFREDQFYRLEAFALRIPPLRERGEDLEILTGHFWNRSALDLCKEIPRISTETMRKSRQYPFPGNVRELKNAIARAVAFYDGEELLPSHLSCRIHGYAGGPSKAEETGPWAPPEILNGDRDLPLRRLENLYVRHVLGRLGGNRRKAASVLGISRSRLYRCLDNDRE